MQGLTLLLDQSRRLTAKSYQLIQQGVVFEEVRPVLSEPKEEALIGIRHVIDN